MTEQYPVIDVCPESISAEESLGGKEKFWFDHNDEKWLFKYPRENTGEHWSEKLAYEIGKHLGIDCAEVELATWETNKGSAGKSFLPKQRGLLHGADLLAEMKGYDKSKLYGQNQHSVDNIFAKLQERDGNQFSKTFFSYMLLDAVIGNTDRHHENWAVLSLPGQKERMAPSFDHASSLGREMQDTKRRALLQNKHIGVYAQRARGGIYGTEKDKKPLAPMAALRLVYEKLPQTADIRQERLTALKDGAMKDIVAKMPPGWMSNTAAEFAVAFVVYNVERILKKFAPSS